MTPEDPRAELERLRKLKRLRELETKAALTGPKMSIGEAARIAGRQGRTLSLADEAAGIRGMAGIPQWADTAYQAVNPMARAADIGMGLAGLAGEAMGAMPGSYTQARDVARGELSQARTDRPVTSFLAEMGEGAAYPAGTLRMGAPILSQSLKMAGIGGLYGGATGYAGAEGDTEQRLGSAALYGGLGAGIGAITPGGVAAALPVFRAGKTAVAKATDAIVNLFGGTGTASEQAAREVAEAAVRRSMERSNMTLERIAEVVERYRDKPAVLAEVIGQDALNALTSLTRRPGVTPQLAQDIISERFGAFPERAGADVRGAADVPEAFIEGDLSAELAARRAAAGPEYQQLYAETPITQTMQPAQQGPVTSERLRNLMETPFISSKLRAAQNNAITRAVAEGRSPDSVTTLEILDSVKRIVDDEIGKAVKNKAAEEINFLTTTRDALVGELDRITEGRYAAVREIGGEAPRLQAAQQLGNKWRTMKLPEFMRAVQETNPQDMPALQAAVMGSLENSLRRGELNPRVFRTQDIQGKIRAVFGPEAGDELIRRMVAEAELRETGARFAPRVNSVTGTVLESAPSEMLDDGIRFATALARGDRIGIINQAISFMRRRGYTQRQIDEMGRLLLSDPQEGLRRLGVRLPTAPNTGGAASIAAPNAFTGGGPEGPTGGSGPAGPQGPSGGPATPAEGMSAMPEANPFAASPTAPQATENAFTSPYFGRQSMRAARERGPSERVLAMQADWAPVSESMSQASVSAGEVADMAQQATMIRTGPERQAAAEQAAQMMQAVRRQVQDIQAQRAGMATPEDQRLQDLIDLLEPTNDPVLLQSQATMVQQNLARINQAIGLSEVPRPMPPQPSAARRLGFQPTVRDESAVARPRPVAGRYAGAGNDVQPMGFAGIGPNAFVEAGIGSLGGFVAGQQYDITGDGIIDERDTQAGAMMGMAGIPLAARAKPQIADRFFSGLQKAVQGMKLQRASAEQWKGMLNNAPGVKKEELEWTGVMDWLDAQEGQVSKADLDAYVRGNGVQVEEMVKGQTIGDAEAQRQLLPLIEELDRLPLDRNYQNLSNKKADGNALTADEERRLAEFVRRERELERQIEALQSGFAKEGETKFSTFTLPGGENYTELLLTLPEAQTRAIPKRVSDLSPNQKRDFILFNDKNADVTEIPDNELDSVIEEMELTQSAFDDFANRGMRIKQQESYRSSHWSEPNVLAHVRFKDRTGPNGERILAMEEIQSDWHQTGRKQGYKKKGEPATFEDWYAGNGMALFGEPFDQLDARAQSMARQRWEDATRRGFTGAAPDAPFKNEGWVNLALNRMIRKAAEEGYDGISWIPGNVQNGSIVNAADNRADFYDKIVVNAANKIGKKYGAKAERLDGLAKTQEGEPVSLHYMRVTPELKRKALEEGFPLFAGLPFALGGVAGLGMGATQSEERPNAFVQ